MSDTHPTLIRIELGEILVGPEARLAVHDWKYGPSAVPYPETIHDEVAAMPEAARGMDLDIRDFVREHGVAALADLTAKWQNPGRKE